MDHNALVGGVWLVTGAAGQVGGHLVSTLTAQGRPVVGLSRAELDIADAGAVAAALAAVRPAVVINAAAYTAVDRAESEPSIAHRINAHAPGVLAAAAISVGAGMVHLSTDYVFDGRADLPYRPGDPVAPLSVYGASKEAGERAVLQAHPGAHVVRTAWVYGRTGTSFPRTIARVLRERGEVAVVDDQRGSPTWAGDLAVSLIALADRCPPPGRYHCTGSGTTTWWGFARAVAVSLGMDPEVVRPRRTDPGERPAARPMYSVLGMDEWGAAGLPAMRPWLEAWQADGAAGVLAG